MASTGLSKVYALCAFCLGLGIGCGKPSLPAGTGGGNGSGAAGPAAGGASPGGGGGSPVGGAASGGMPGSGGTVSGTGGTSALGSGGSVAELRTFVYVGSGDFGDAEPGLVTVYALERETKKLTYVSEHAAGGLASYLVIDPERRRLFAADEADGGLRSFTIDALTGQLTSLGATAGNNHPVYLSISGDGGHVLAANYNEGSVDVYPIDSTGKAGPSLGATPTGSQAHSVVLDASGHVFVPNKGSDTISLFGFAAGVLSPGTPASVGAPSPRHLTLHGGRAYVVSEEANSIAAYDVGPTGDLTPVWDVPRLPLDGSPQNDTGADVRVTPNGKFLYATNRGTSNTVVAYDLQTSPPTLLEHEPSLGTTPRNFTMDPEGEFIIVANHGATKTLVLFTIGADGRLTLPEPLSVDFSPYFVGVAQFPAP
jgi:6-phosphogluconolactonase